MHQSVKCPKCPCFLDYQGMGKLHCKGCGYAYSIMEQSVDFFDINAWLTRTSFYASVAFFDAARYRNLTGHVDSIKVGPVEQFDCIALIAFDLYVQELRDNDDFEAA